MSSGKGILGELDICIGLLRPVKDVVNWFGIAWNTSVHATRFVL